MDRKRTLIIVAAVVVVVLVLLIGMTLARAWPMISGDTFAVGPTVDDPEWEESISSVSEVPEITPRNVPDRPDVQGAGDSSGGATRSGGTSPAEFIVGGVWVCIQESASQGYGSGYAFLAPTEGTAGPVYVTEDVRVESPEWIEAQYEIADNGYLLITPVSFGMWAVSSEYAVAFEQAEGYDVMYMWSLEDENAAPSVLARPWEGQNGGSTTGYGAVPAGEAYDPARTMSDDERRAADQQVMAGVDAIAQGCVDYYLDTGSKPGAWAAVDYGGTVGPYVVPWPINPYTGTAMSPSEKWVGNYEVIPSPVNVLGEHAAGLRGKLSTGEWYEVVIPYPGS